MKRAQTNYQNSIRVLSDPKTAFLALTQELSSWWGKMNKPIDSIGDIFTVSWGTPWYQFEVAEYLPFEKITWKCIDANQLIEGLDGVQKEWVGTQLVWKITAVNNHKIEIQFEHLGLVPDFICYSFCSATWDHFIQNKLKSFLESQ